MHPSPGAGEEEPEGEADRARVRLEALGGAPLRGSARYRSPTDERDRVMDDSTINLLLTFGIIAVIFVAVGVYIMVLMPKGKLAETEADEDGPFILRLRVPARPPKLWIRYQVAFPGHDHAGRQFGLMLDLELEAEGQPTQKLKLGKGAHAGDKYLESFNTEMFTRHQRGPDGSLRSASVKLIDLEEWEPGSELVIRGTVATAETTELLGLKVYVAK